MIVSVVSGDLPSDIAARERKRKEAMEMQAGSQVLRGIS